jgi:photosystem II stability/assembly factor-like uncharacterized protein
MAMSHATDLEREIEPARSGRDKRAMNTRASALFIHLCTSAAAVAGLNGCLDDSWMGTTSLEVGSDADLNAVVHVFDDYADAHRYSHIAVGSGGTVVAWGWDDEERFVERSSVGEADLRAVHVTWTGSWWVVGDEGTVAVSDDNGLSWTTIDIGTTADLYAITGYGEHGHVVVGDEVVFLQADDGSWSEKAAPGGSWGRLRSIDYHGDLYYAVGLGGAVWAADDPSERWSHETVGGGADLFDICVYYVNEHGGSSLVNVVGADGTMLLGERGDWTKVDTGLSVDLINCDNEGVLAADGRVFEFVGRSGPELEELETFPGARAFVLPYYYDLVVVGDDGTVRLKSKKW